MQFFHCSILQKTFTITLTTSTMSFIFWFLIVLFLKRHKNILIKKGEAQVKFHTLSFGMTLISQGVMDDWVLTDCWVINNPWPIAYFSFWRLRCQNDNRQLIILTDFNHLIYIFVIYFNQNMTDLQRFVNHAFLVSFC